LWPHWLGRGCAGEYNFYDRFSVGSYKWLTCERFLQPRVRSLARGICLPSRTLHTQAPPIYQLQIGHKTGRKNAPAKQFCGRAQRARRRPEGSKGNKESGRSAGAEKVSGTKCKAANSLVLTPFSLILGGPGGRCKSHPLLSVNDHQPTEAPNVPTGSGQHSARRTRLCGSECRRGRASLRKLLPFQNPTLPRHHLLLGCLQAHLLAHAIVQPSPAYSRDGCDPPTIRAPFQQQVSRLARRGS
jgi:hypothetical protein